MTQPSPPMSEPPHTPPHTRSPVTTKQTSPRPPSPKPSAPRPHRPPPTEDQQGPPPPPTPRPPAPPPPQLPPYQIDANPPDLPGAPPYRCFILGCPQRPFSSNTPGRLKAHYLTHHRPLSRIPAELIRDPMRRCPTCHALFIGAKNLANHHAAAHASVAPPADLSHLVAQRLSAVDDSLPHAHAIPPPADAITRNTAFLASLPLRSLALHEVHGNAAPLPPTAAAAYDVILNAALCAALADPNEDAPVTLVYALPRLLLAPFPPNSARGGAAETVRRRAVALREGRAQTLWDAHPWAQTIAARSTTTLRVTPDGDMGPPMTRACHTSSPSAAFKMLQTAPFLPPRLELAPLFQKKIHTTPHPSLLPHALPAAARQHLPTQPFPSAASRLARSPAQQARAALWLKRLHANPGGAPDGTGLRTETLLLCTTALRPLAHWLDILTLGHVTTDHRALLTTMTAGGQCKPDKTTGEYPRTVAEVKAIRPLSKHNVIRRHLARALAKVTNIQHRTRLESFGQYGSSPDGIALAARRLQLLSDQSQHPAPPHAHPAALPYDMENAHCDISREAIREDLLNLTRAPTASPNDTLNLIYFDLYYTTPSRVLLLTQHPHELLHVLYQYRGLNQGDGVAGPFYNSPTSRVTKEALAPFPLATATLIHDDGTLSAPIAVDAEQLRIARLHLPPDAPHAHFAPTPVHPTRHDDPTISLYLAHAFDAVALALLHRCDLVAERHKLHLQHLPSATQPSLASVLLPAFPTGTVIDPSYSVVGGGPFGSPDGVRAYLTAVAEKYETLLCRLTAIPALSAHGALLILLVSLKPTARFNHHYRLIPPSLTRHTTKRLKDAMLAAVARVLRIALTHITDAPPAQATLFQAFLPALIGGLGIPDPTSLAHTAFLASMADTLPALLADPFTGPLIPHHEAWATSHSPNLADTASSFAIIMALPCLLDQAAAQFPPPPGQRPSAIVALLHPTTGVPTLARLQHAARLHLQSPLQRAVHTHTLALALTPPPHAALPPLTAATRARLRACGTPGAAALLTATNMTDPRTRLDQTQLTLWVTMRLGIDVPHVHPTALTKCLPRCTSINPTTGPATGAHPHAPIALQGLHAIQCGVGPHRIGRHNEWLRCFAIAATELAGPQATCDTTKHLSSSDTSGRQIDAQIDDPSTPTPLVSIDAVITSPLHPTYLADAAEDAAATFAHHAERKYEHHAAGCSALDRTFLSLVGNVYGGIGPSTAPATAPGPAHAPRMTALSWFRATLSAAVAREKAEGGSGAVATQAAANMLIRMNVILARRHAAAVLLRTDG